MSGGAGRRHGLHPVWLWRRPAAVATIRPLAWELPRAMDAAPKSKRKKKEKEKERKKETEPNERSIH